MHCRSASSLTVSRPVHDPAPRICAVQFQLATAIRARTGFREEGPNAGGDEAADLARAADALERSARLEGAAVKLGANGIEDLTVCLNALGEGGTIRAAARRRRFVSIAVVRSSSFLRDGSQPPFFRVALIWRDLVPSRDAMPDG